MRASKFRCVMLLPIAAGFSSAAMNLGHRRDAGGAQIAFSRDVSDRYTTVRFGKNRQWLVMLRLVRRLPRELCHLRVRVGVLQPLTSPAETNSRKQPFGLAIRINVRSRQHCGH